MFQNYSVLMSVYAKEKPDYLRNAIESILNQTIQTNDFVIVEDGPLTEELNYLLDRYASRYSSIHLIKKEKNSGLGASLNIGLKECKNELVARMDSDDIALPERCEEELKRFNLMQNLDIVGTAIYEFVVNEEAIEFVKYMPESNDEIINYAKRRNPFNHSTVMYKKSAILRCGGYLEGIRGEDFALFTKMVFEGARGQNINIPLLKYRSNPDQYQRRTSKVEKEAVISVAKNNYNKGYITFKDYMFICCAQNLASIIPNKLGNQLYKKIFRKSTV